MQLMDTAGNMKCVLWCPRQWQIFHDLWPIKSRHLYRTCGFSMSLHWLVFWFVILYSMISGLVISISTAVLVRGLLYMWLNSNWPVYTLDLESTLPNELYGKRNVIQRSYVSNSYKSVCPTILDKKHFWRLFGFNK